MNWGSWISGAIVAIVTGLITVLGVLATLESCPTGWKLFVIGGIPTLISFFAYIKQTPPPIGSKPEVK